MKIQRKSLHAQLYLFGNNYLPESIDLCSYVKGVFKGILKSLFAIVAGSFLGILTLDPLLTGILTLVYGWNGPLIDEFVFLLGLLSYGVILASLVLLFCVYYTTEYFKTVKNKEDRFKFIKTVYKGWKEKYCPILEVEK